MRVCFFLGGLTGNGGIGRVTSILSNTMVKNPTIKIYVLSYADTHKPLLYQIDQRIKTYSLFSNPLSMKSAVFHNIVGKLRKYIKDNKIDILVACGSLYFPVAVCACKGIITKCICWDHTGPQVTTDHAFQAWSRKFGAKYSDVNVLLTKRAKQYYDEKWSCTQKNIIIYNPIDPEAVIKRKEYSINAKKIITVGRLTYQKNMELLVEIANKVLKNNPGWTWDIYGEGDLKTSLQEKIMSYGLENLLTLKGQVSNVYELYGNYAFKVLTSRYEGFPMTLLEASANGLPMISFNIETGPNEIIENGVNGFLVSPMDKDAMQIAIETLIRDDELRKKMSIESVKKSEHFQIDAIIKQWYALFESLE